uniref:Uncharacterized protein n=1 Tax=uncultured Thiotrichaceae bacterium TaxID=298394 RepID=A0A6S6UJM6_9GAMM|nr:MAG: Unknown protein [uncultured Thiotrichaceae bacterium]
MRGMVPPEVDSGPSQQCFAAVYMPKFKSSRKRFPASCVEVSDDMQDVITQCEGDEKRFPAQVVGPSKSSEGQFIYYLVRWL